MSGRKAAYVATLDDLCGRIPHVAARRDQLLLVLKVIDKLDQGGIMDAVIHSKGYLNTISDAASQSVKIVWNNGWALGFEGEGGEMVILIDAISRIRERKTGLEIELDSGESIWLRFHGEWRRDPVG